MNTIAQRPDDSPELLRKSAVYSVLDDICRDLELTEGQLSAARTSYETVAEWLSKSTEPFLSNVSVYAHGSAGLGTSVKPLGREDFDVDLICLAPDFTADRSPAELKRLVGDRLRENATYARMLEEKKRCWRLNYAREFHLDISPTIVNLKCMNGGELVPDKKLRDWKPTNPSGYKALFEARAKLKPRVRLTKSGYVSDQANVEPFPSKPTGKGVLRRTVQLLKRHRDIHFQDVTEEVAPISIIITTLAAQAYECCHRMFTFDTELDVLVAIVRMMPHFIERRVVNGRVELWVVNETTEEKTSLIAGIQNQLGLRLSLCGMRRRCRTLRTQPLLRELTALPMALKTSSEALLCAGSWTGALRQSRRRVTLVSCLSDRQVV